MWLVFNESTNELYLADGDYNKDEAIREAMEGLGYDDVEPDDSWKATRLTTEQVRELGYRV